MRFIANLRKETLASFAANGEALAGYLLSAHRATPALLETAGLVRQSDALLVADNGTKPMIDEIIDRFEEDAGRLRQDLKEVRRALGHVPRGREVPAALRKRAVELADEVVTAATALSESTDQDMVLEVQLSMRPTHLIAREDFATACLIGLGLGDRNVTGWRIGRIDTRNRRSLRLWRQVRDDPRCAGITVYAVLSATDYNTARSAARIAADRGARHVAYGLAGLARDPSATDFYVLGRRSFRLDPPVARRHVRLAEILRGFADGFDESAPGALESLHCLGLGSPRLQPLAAAALPDPVFLTSDATSPIHEAARNRVLYDPDDHGSRASTRSVVDRIVRGRTWSFASPFHERFREEFGHDPESGRTWWRSEGEPAITDQLLSVPSDLTTAMPLFAAADGDVKPIAVESHIAHNHWIVDRLTRQLGESGDRRSNARRLVAEIAAGGSTVTKRGLTAALRLLETD